MERPKHINRQQQVSSSARLLVQWHRYKHLLIARWWLILLTLIAALGIQWLMLKRLPATFISDGQMIVNVKLSIPSENTYSEELANFYGTQVALMQSDTVINRVNEHLALTNPKWQPQHVKIQVSLTPKTSIFDLKAVGADPVGTQAYLEETMEQYIKLKRDLLANASAAAKNNLQDELAQLLVKLDKSKQDYLNFQASNSVVLLQEAGGNNAATYLSTLSKQRAEYQSELQLLNSLTADENLTQQPGILAPPSPALPLSPTEGNFSPGAGTTMASSDSGGISDGSSPAVSNGPEASYLQAIQQLLLLKAQRDELYKQAPRAPELVVLADKIATQEKLLEIMRDQSREQFNNRKHTLAVKIEHLNNEVNDWEARALDASKKLSVFEALKENHQQLQTMYDQLVASLQTLDMDKGTGQESVTILQPATPAMYVPRKTVAHMIMAGFIGLIAGIGILMLLDQMNDRPMSFLELEALFDQPILAQFPWERPPNKKIGVPVLQKEDDRHMLVEAYQNLRSALIYKHSPADHPRSIVIASASPQDGKSTVSANLAITLAQSGARVLLVDADLRRGRLHDQFGLPAAPGLAEVLAQDCDWARAVVPTSIPNLSLLPAGARPRRPGSLFAMHTSKFLADIAGHYEYYLFDTAPVMAADDVSSLAPHVDGLIMVIRAGCTSGRVAKVALDLLRLRNVNVIGLAFNAVKTNGAGYQRYEDKSYYPQQTSN